MIQYRNAIIGDECMRVPFTHTESAQSEGSDSPPAAVIVRCACAIDASIVFRGDTESATAHSNSSTHP